MPFHFHSFVSLSTWLFVGSGAPLFTAFKKRVAQTDRGESEFSLVSVPGLSNRLCSFGLNGFLHNFLQVKDVCFPGTLNLEHAGGFLWGVFRDQLL